MLSPTHQLTGDLTPIIRTNLQLTPALEKQMLQVQLAAFLTAYKDLSNEDLQIPDGMTKADWYTQLLNDDLSEVKAGLMSIIAVFVEDELMGFATCKNVKPRHPKVYEQALFEENKTPVKHDVHISILAARPIRESMGDDKRFMHLGIGKMLVDAVGKHFQEANYITLDARHVNKSTCRFYHRAGFNIVPGISFEGHDLAYYRGYEKPTAEYKCKP